jgi:hypothetical protein
LPYQSQEIDHVTSGVQSIVIVLQQSGLSLIQLCIPECYCKQSINVAIP